eukprot:2889253-Lingulodinium_polyedra.AAC.1
MGGPARRGTPTAATRMATSMGARPCPCGHHRPGTMLRAAALVLEEAFGTAPAPLARGLAAW